MGFTRCWNCTQPATNVMTREGSETLNACDNCTHIDRSQAEANGWTITATAKDDSAEQDTYTAALATASDVVFGDFCDVSVVESEVISYRQGSDGYDIPVYGMTSVVAMDAVETTVRTDADSYGHAESEADEILAANGWIRTGDWEPSDNAYYAPVAKA